MTSHAMRAIPPKWAGMLPTKHFAVGHPQSVGMWISDGEVVRVQDGRGLLLSVKHGSAWVTQAGSIKDVFVGPGESFRLERDGCTLVSAGAAAATAVVTLTRPTRTATLHGLPGAFLAWAHRHRMSLGQRAINVSRVAS